MTRPAWAGLAGHALNDVIHERYQQAADAVTCIAMQYGPAVIPAVMAGWIDITAKASGFKRGGDHALKWVNPDTHASLDGEELAPDVRWAGRLFVAHVNRDTHMFAALINSVRSNDEWATNVRAVLQLCGVQLRERGLELDLPTGEQNR